MRAKPLPAERRELSAGCLKPRVFNGFELADFEVCTSRVYQCRATRPGFESIPEFEQLDADRFKTDRKRQAAAIAWHRSHLSEVQ